MNLQTADDMPLDLARVWLVYHELDRVNGHPPTRHDLCRLVDITPGQLKSAVGRLRCSHGHTLLFLDEAEREPEVTPKESLVYAARQQPDTTPTESTESTDTTPNGILTSQGYRPLNPLEQRVLDASRALEAQHGRHPTHNELCDAAVVSGCQLDNIVARLRANHYVIEFLGRRPPREHPTKTYADREPNTDKWARQADPDRLLALAAAERTAIHAALERADGDLQRTAGLLRISTVTLIRKLNDLGVPLQRRTPA